MKTSFYFTFLMIFLQACTHYEDDFISKYCPGSCTIIEGKLTTDDGSKPLVGVKVELIWDETSMLGGTIRTKAAAITDRNGNYRLRSLLRDGELPGKGYSHGDFYVKASINTDNYLTCANSQQIQFYPSLDRNITYQLNYLAPQKAYVILEATNLMQIGVSDNFRTEAIFKIGEDGNSLCGRTIGWYGKANTVTDTIEVAANQQVNIKTTKLKNSTETITETALNLKPGQYTKLQLSF